MRIFIALTMLVNLSTFANITFVDLTGKKYRGKTEDIQDLNFRKMGFDCDPSSTVQAKGQHTVISWAGSSYSQRIWKDKKAYRKSIANYKIHFSLYNRNGKKVASDSFVYDDKRHKTRRFVVPGDHGAYSDCEMERIFFDKQYDIPYGKVEYWISEIKWKYLLLKPHKSKRKAFTLKDHLESLNKKKKKKVNK